MTVSFKDISEEGFSFSSNLEIINASLKFLTKVPTHTQKNSIFIKNQIHMANL